MWFEALISLIGLKTTRPCHVLLMISIPDPRISRIDQTDLEQLLARFFSTSSIGDIWIFFR